MLIKNFVGLIWKLLDKRTNTRAITQNKRNLKSKPKPHQNRIM